MIPGMAGVVVLPGGLWTSFDDAGRRGGRSEGRSRSLSNEPGGFEWDGERDGEGTLLGWHAAFNGHFLAVRRQVGEKCDRREVHIFFSSRLGLFLCRFPLNYGIYIIMIVLGVILFLFWSRSV